MDEEELYDRYLDACLAGEVEAPDVFCARHPELGQRMRAKISALHLMMTEQQAAEAVPEPLQAEDGLPFERLGEFRLLRRLEKGGMGMVFLAEQTSLGRPVALKVVRPELQDSPTARERFRREALAIARLSHPNIVQVFAMGEDEDVRYIAMELVPGRELDEILKTETPRVSRVVRWMLKLARALDTAHREGVVHRDVKPSNIRITPDDRPQLLDFGIARDTRWKGETLTQAFTGSPLYAAPEQLSGRKEIDGRADVYALGATLYQCLCGRVPFGGDAMEQVFAQVLHDDPVSPRRLNPSISRDLDVITLKALAKDPARRYQTAGELADDLEALLEFRPIRARAPGPWDRFLKWCRRRPGPAAALATVVLALVAWAVWAHFDRKADARAAVAEARERLRAYRERRATTKNLEAEVIQLQRKIHAQYMTAEQEKTLEEKETEVANFRRAREEVFYAVLDLLRKAEQLDPDVDGIDQVRAELFVEKWQEARNVKDDAAEAFYAERIARYDPGVLSRLRPVSRFTFLSTPPGADVYLFRYREPADLFEGGEHRLVPVPDGWEKLPVRPGTWCLRVLGTDELIVELAGHPIRDCLLATEAAGPVQVGDRLVSIDGRPVRSLWDVAEAKEPQRFGFERAGRRFETNDAVAVAPPAVLAARGGVAAKVYRMGELSEETLPAGLAVRTTAAPVLLSAWCRVGATPLPQELEVGHYLLVFRHEGYESVRFVVEMTGNEKGVTDIRLPVAGSTPAGFVSVRAQAEGIENFWIMEREVTAAEYLEFLNDPATLRRIDGAEDRIFVPRDRDEFYWELGEEGRYVLRGDWEADWPVLGVSWNDAVAYARWHTRRTPGFVFSLPTKKEWLLAAHGSSTRHYPFGNRFRPKWVKSCYARPRAIPEPVMRFPIDESALGVYDMCGGAMEWLDDWYDEGRGMRRIAGGSWGRARPEIFKLYGTGYQPTAASGDFGFRLVMRKVER